ncbi:RIP metalloprotease RseP [Arcobacter sp. FWKO B]|uniref:RIP metalloprotease RseP n=1 Tax=Arcobacter sp. FWKO B TaxID=2593672 RepID=UPI0018A3EC81|nr:RIP metalloprotease RseP [Arcobacter sp. FWKO B]QOG13181.1 RIP metalloprotease RseP [Arcobacter sp. FWKO B]
MGLITFLLVLSLLIFIHELGHFLAARYFGVTVHKFSIGFGKPIYKKYYKGTLWQVATIPLGGYVQMKGQDDMHPTLQDSGSDSYNQKKPWQRIVILFAGPFANFFLAAILFFFIAILGSNNISPTIGTVLENSPAQKAGLMADDVILKINDKDIKSWDDLSKIIKKSNEPLRFIVLRENKQRAITLYPQMMDSKNMFGEDIRQKMIGISPAPKIITVEHSPLEAIAFAYEKTIESSKMIFLGVQKLIQGIVPSSEIGGVITIGKVISDASEVGLVALLGITALISVNLGVLNLLPIPALDGGHIMFNLYEMITRKKPNEKVLLNLTIGGWVILIFLMGLGLYNDINRILNGWWG